MRVNPELPGLWGEALLWECAKSITATTEKSNATWPARLILE
jgi:hypothetical protein